MIGNVNHHVCEKNESIHYAYFAKKLHQINELYMFQKYYISYKSKGLHVLIKLNVVLRIILTQGVKKSTIENENQTVVLSRYMSVQFCLFLFL